MYFLQLDIDPDKVTVDETVLQRPARICASDWMDFWEKVRDVASSDAVVRRKGAFYHFDDERY